MLNKNQKQLINDLSNELERTFDTTGTQNYYSNLLAMAKKEERRHRDYAQAPEELASVALVAKWFAILSLTRDVAIKRFKVKDILFTQPSAIYGQSIVDNYARLVRLAVTKFDKDEIDALQTLDYSDFRNTK